METISRESPLAFLQETACFFTYNNRNGTDDLTGNNNFVN